MDLTGKIAIVTGGYAGIGLETVKTFSRAEADVIVAACDWIKAAKNLEGIPNVTTEVMNLMAPASIDTFAKKFRPTDQPLHMLVNNAGIRWGPLQRNTRGYESPLATQHLDYFQLTARLWSILSKKSVSLF